MNFSPAVSSETKTRLRREMRRWGVARRSDKTLTDLALMSQSPAPGLDELLRKVLQVHDGSGLAPLQRHAPEVGHAEEQTTAPRPRRARRFIADVARREPGLFAHWKWVCALTVGEGSPVSGEGHAGFCESRRLRRSPATRLVVCVAGGKEHAEALKTEVEQVIAPLGLKLSPEKTRVVSIDEGLGRAGARCRRCRRSVSPTRSPNRTCPFLSIRLSTGRAMADPVADFMR